MDALVWAAVPVALVLGAAAGPRISWAIRAWPGHEAFHCDYLKCATCAGGIRRGCYNAGSGQDRFYQVFSALAAALSVGLFGLGTKALLSWVFSVSSLVIAVVDFRFLIIPDLLSIGGYKVGLSYAAMASFSVWWGFAPPQHYVPFVDSLIGFALGGGFLKALGWVAWIILKKEGMGGGDVKLLAAIGAWLGWKPVVGTIVLASLLGSIGGILGILWRRVRYGQVYRPLEHQIPFGPYLCVGFLFIFYAGLDPLFWLMERYQIWLDAHLLPR